MVMECFRSNELFPLAIMFSYLCYGKLLRCGDVDWREVIVEIGRHPALSTEMSLEVLNVICKDNEGNARQVVKSGFVKYIVSCYLEQKL